jgi:dUTP pyrophosphatase
MIVPRSGLGFKYYFRLANLVGIIDFDYADNPNNEGHCWIKLRSESSSYLSIDKGEAIAQGIFQKFLLVDGDCFEGAERNGGLGSTS